MLKIGLSINESYMNEEFFKSCKSAGIDCIELSPTEKGHDTLDFDAVAKMICANGLETWTYHLPFLPFESLDISRPDLAKYSVEYLSSLIRRAGAAGIKRFVLHSSGEPIDDAERAVRMETAKNSISVLANVALECGGRLLIENLPRTVLGKNSDEMLELLSSHPSLRSVFDTNHLLSENAIDFIKKIGHTIESTHVSDYDLVDEKHWLPGEGAADFTSIFKALEDVGYNGPWLYEVSLTNTPKITRSRSLTPEDYVRNAKELFSGAPFTVVK